jgi:formate--tetrahydrofolate ligase
MNDRSLRRGVVGLVGNGVPREERFDITAASEIMAVLCLAADLADLKVRLARIVAAYDMDGKPVTAGQLGAAGAMAALLRDATRPNLVQTLAHTPALLHGGPFANIAHGCNSIRATKTALKMGDVVVTEAGFGADLGAEKFLDVKCRQGGIWPDAAVVVATIRALKHHGGAGKDELAAENLDALRAGLPNLEAHVKNLKNVFGLPVAVALNRFSADTEAELELVVNAGKEWGVPICLTEVWAKGGAGGIELAKALEPHLGKKLTPQYTYADDLSLRDKINAIAKRIYGAASVAFEPGVLTSLKKLESLGYGRLPVIISKTQYSFSSDEKKLGRPTGFALKVTDCRVSAGAGFVVVYTGEVMTMPGLSPVPSAEAVDMDVSGVISGLF